MSSSPVTWSRSSWRARARCAARSWRQPTRSLRTERCRGRRRTRERSPPASTRPGPSRCPKDALAAFRRVSNATLTVQLAKRGVANTFLTGLRPLRTDLRMVGYARTLRYVATREDVREARRGSEDAQKRAVETLSPGDVLIMEARGEAGAGTIGDILAARVLARGGAGIVTDGGVRDSPGVAQLAIPTYCQSVPRSVALARAHTARRGCADHVRRRAGDARRCGRRRRRGRGDPAGRAGRGDRPRRRRAGGARGVGARARARRRVDSAASTRCPTSAAPSTSAGSPPATESSPDEQVRSPAIPPQSGAPSRRSSRRSRTTARWTSARSSRSSTGSSSMARTASRSAGRPASRHRRRSPSASR